MTNQDTIWAAQIAYSYVDGSILRANRSGDVMVGVGEREWVSPEAIRRVIKRRGDGQFAGCANAAWEISEAERDQILAADAEITAREAEARAEFRAALAADIKAGQRSTRSRSRCCPHCGTYCGGDCTAADEA